MSESQKSSNNSIVKFTSLVAITASIAAVASAVAAWRSSYASWSSADTAKLSYELTRKLGEASHMPEVSVMLPDTLNNEAGSFSLSIPIGNIGQNQLFIRDVSFAIGTFSENDLMNVERSKIQKNEIKTNLLMQPTDKYWDTITIRENKKWPISEKIQLTTRIIVQNDIGQLFLRYRCDNYLKQPNGAYKSVGLCNYLNSISMDEEASKL